MPFNFFPKRGRKPNNFSGYEKYKDAAGRGYISINKTRILLTYGDNIGQS